MFFMYTAKHSREENVCGLHGDSVNHKSVIHKLPELVCCKVIKVLQREVDFPIPSTAKVFCLDYFAMYGAAR